MIIKLLKMLQQGTDHAQLHFDICDGTTARRVLLDTSLNIQDIFANETNGHLDLVVKIEIKYSNISQIS